MAEATTEKIVGGRYRTPEGKYVDCNGYSLDEGDKERELANKIAEMQAELDSLKAQHDKPLPVPQEVSDKVYPVPEPRLEAGSLSAQKEGMNATKPDPSDHGKAIDSSKPDQLPEDRNVQTVAPEVQKEVLESVKDNKKEK